MKICIKRTKQEFLVPESIVKHFPQQDTLTIQNATATTINFIFDTLAHEDVFGYVQEKGPQEFINIADALYTANHFKLVTVVKALEPLLHKCMRHQNVGEPNKQLRFSSSFYGDEDKFLHRDFQVTFNKE